MVQRHYCHTWPDLVTFGGFGGIHTVTHLLQFILKSQTHLSIVTSQIRQLWLYCAFLHIAVFPIVECIALYLIVLIIFWIIRHLCLYMVVPRAYYVLDWYCPLCKETTKEGTGSFLLSCFLRPFSETKLCLKRVVTYHGAERFRQSKSIFSSSVGEHLKNLASDQSIRRINAAFVMVWGKNIDVCWVWLLIGLPSLSTESLHGQYQKIRAQWKR